MPSLSRIACALAVFAVTLALFTNFSDGRLSVFDPYDYGEGLQNLRVEDLDKDAGYAALHPNHLLFHIVGFGLTNALEGLGFEEPGHLATRLLGAIGAALCVLAVSSFARARAGSLGLIAALPLICARGFLFDGAAGESILPALAVGLFAIRHASSDRVSGPYLVFLLFLTCSVRQDGILFVPAIAALAFPKLGARRTTIVLASAGAATLALYLAHAAVTST